MDDKAIKVLTKELEKAYKAGEVPVAALITKNQKIISKAHNEIEKRNDPTSHAEILAIQKASKKLKNWRLDDCIMYTTLKPCDMCMGAINQSRIKTAYYYINKQNLSNFNNEIIKKDNKLFEEKIIFLLQTVFKKKRK